MRDFRDAKLWRVPCVPPRRPRVSRSPSAKAFNRSLSYSAWTVGTRSPRRYAGGPHSPQRRLSRPLPTADDPEFLPLPFADGTPNPRSCRQAKPIDDADASAMMRALQGRSWSPQRERRQLYRQRTKNPGDRGQPRAHAGGWFQRVVQRAVRVADALDREAIGAAGRLPAAPSRRRRPEGTHDAVEECSVHLLPLRRPERPNQRETK
jgi:hypothetical protein